MPVEPLRAVTDRWEWASLAHQTPSVYHSHSWTVAAVEQLRSTSRSPTAYAYLRLWTPTGALVCCPVIRHGNRWFNTPRASPVAVLGECADPHRTLLDAVRTADMKPSLTRLEIHDDHEPTELIETIAAQLERAGTMVRRYRELERTVVAQLVRRVRWTDDAEAAAWLMSLRNAWRFGDWAVELRAYYDNRDEPVGWAVWCLRDGLEQCIASARVAARAPAWTTAR